MPVAWCFWTNFVEYPQDIVPMVIVVVALVLLGLAIALVVYFRGEDSERRT